MSDYDRFIESKCHRVEPVGFEPVSLHPSLRPDQRDITRWACRLGRAADWADCGLGKSRVQTQWAAEVARHAGGDVLILAPLAVGPQTVAEGAAIGVDVRLCRTQADVRPGVNITNYEMLSHFDARHFAGVVLDESSILKAYDGTTRNAIVGAFRDTRYKLACSATPAPNDFMEIGNHAEFLGVMSRMEMLSTFFVHDGGETSKWRLKGHAETEFWRWLCSWAVMLRRPSDLGYSDEGFVLPPLEMHQATVKGDHRQAQKAGLLFALEAQTLEERRAARKASSDERVRAVAELVLASSEPWLLWCDYNDEGDALEKEIPGSVQVSGTDDKEFKENAALWFAGKLECPCGRKSSPEASSPMTPSGLSELRCTCGRLLSRSRRVLISKARIFGWGLNFQHCSRVAFVGLSDSFEAFYQAIRRCWRFGQKRTVHCWIVTSELEGAVVKNLQRKEADAARMVDEMVRHMSAISSESLKATARQVIDYRPEKPMQLPAWLRSAA